MISSFLNNVGATINLTVVGLVLVAISASNTIDASQQGIVGSAAMIGAVAGQLVMGLVGDCLGRTPALLLTTVIILLGSFLSAFYPAGDSLMFNLALCRLIAGFGVGGVYPLTAVASAEEKGSKGASSILLVFSGQGWGQLLSPLLVYGLAKSKMADKDVWRTTLALAAIPSVAALLLLMRQMYKKRQDDQLESIELIVRAAGDHPMNAELSDVQERRAAAEMGAIGKSPQTFYSTLCSRKNMVKLLGVGGTWFLFDLTFYANVVFAPVVLERAFGVDTNSGISEIAGATCLVMLIALPGYYVAVAIVHRTGLKRLQMFGFISMAILFGILAAAGNVLPPGVLFVIYSLTFFFANMGPNSTTFCLPSRTFPKASRATFNGLAAAMGKAGAIVGTALFPSIIQAGGAPAALGLSAGIALLGAILTWFLVEAEFIPQTMRARRVGDSTLVGFIEMGAPNFTSTSLEREDPNKRMPFASQNNLAHVDDDRNPFALGMGTSSASYARVREDSNAGTLERS